MGLGLLTLSPLPLFAQDKPDLGKLLTVRKGTLPVVVSAPHGGRLAIPGAEERTGTGVEKFVTVNDTNTDQLAEKYAYAAVQRAFPPSGPGGGVQGTQRHQGIAIHSTVDQVLHVLVRLPATQHIAEGIA